MNSKLTDLERDLGSGPLPKPVLLQVLQGLSEDSEELIDLRYDNGRRVRLAGDFVEEFGWKPRETSRRILSALDELNKLVKGITESEKGSQENDRVVSGGNDEGSGAVG